MYKTSDIQGHFNREFDNKGRIEWTTCDGCGSDKGQWLDESNTECGYELNAVICTKCAKGYLKMQDDNAAKW